MVARGYRYSDDEPALALDPFFVMPESSNTLPRASNGVTCSDVGSGSCIGQYRKRMAYATEVTRRIKSALVLQMIDAQRKQVAWEGVAVGGRKNSGRDLKQLVFENVTAIFGEFPYLVTA